MRRKKTYPANFAALALATLLILVLFPACDCGSTKNSANPEPVEGPDDDSISDDDTSVDDDGDDDASTTTTSPSTTTSTGFSTTTTTVVTTTSSTTTTLGPEGSACNPYTAQWQIVASPIKVGPWPEFELNGLTFQQISGGAKTGPNGIVQTSDGIIRIAAREGLSLDLISVDADGLIEREVIHPMGGETKVLVKDTQDHLYLAYTYRPDTSQDVRELRFATNKSGEWQVQTILTVDHNEPDFDMTVDTAGIAHFVYADIAFNDTSVYYATFDGDTFTETPLEGNDVDWRFGCYIAVDANDEPRIVFSDTNGLWYWTKIGYVWTSELAALGFATRDFLIDENGDPHIATTKNATGTLHHGVRQDGAWNIEEIDPCTASALHVSMLREISGAMHFFYTDSDVDRITHATFALGAWKFTRLGERYSDDAWEVAATTGTDGTPHIVHLNHDRESFDELYHTTIKLGNWLRTRIVGSDALAVGDGVLDAEGGLNFPMIVGFSEGVGYGRLDQNGWEWEQIEGTGEKYGVENEMELRIDEGGNIYIAYANNVIPSVRYATKTVAGWSIANISDGQSATRVNLELDTENYAHVSYNATSGGYAGWYGTNKSGAWSTELIPGSFLMSNFILNRFNEPVVACLANWDLMLSKKIETGWTTEIARSNFTGGLIPMAVATDNSLRLISKSQEIYFSTNELGSWETEILLFGSSSDSIVIDESGSTHILSSADDPDSGNVGVVYQTNMSGQWESMPIFLEMGVGSVDTLHMTSDGQFLGLFGAGGFFTVKFPIGIRE